MSYYINTEINIFALFMLVILFINMYRRAKNFLPDEKLFVYIIAVTCLILIIDAAQWSVDSQPGLFLLNKLLILFYYILNPLPCILWCFYIRYQFSMNERDAKARMYLSVPTIVCIVISVLSFSNEWFYYVDQNNVYHRGNVFWLFLLISLVYLLYAFFYIIINRKKLAKMIYYSLLMFWIPPVIGGTFQTLFYGISLIWPCVSLSLLIIYIYIQNSQIFMDHLTGLYNRRQLDIYLDGYLNKTTHKSPIGGIMLDIDNFKSINDQYGHTTGDQALVNAASILRKSVWNNGFLARFGGDEFIVFLHAKTIADIEQIVSIIEYNVNAYNQQSKEPYQLKFSMGYDIFKYDRMLTKTHMLNRIDRLMYDNKQAAKQDSHKI